MPNLSPIDHFKKSFRPGMLGKKPKTNPVEACRVGFVGGAKRMGLGRSPEQATLSHDHDLRLSKIDQFLVFCSGRGSAPIKPNGTLSTQQRFKCG